MKPVFLMDDVLEIRNESNDSYYRIQSKSPHKLSISHPKNSTNLSFVTNKNFKLKKLPPLCKENSHSLLKRSLDSSTSSLHELNSSVSPREFGQFRKIDLCGIKSAKSCENSDNSNILPIITDNKKKLPEKIQAIDQIAQNISTSTCAFEAPIPFDIFTESGVYSRQSLEPLSTNRHSSRPSSCKEGFLTRKISLSSKLRSIKIENQDKPKESCNMNSLAFNKKSIIVTKEKDPNEIEVQSVVNDNTTSILDNYDRYIDQNISDFELDEDFFNDNNRPQTAKNIKSNDINTESVSCYNNTSAFDYVASNLSVKEADQAIVNEALNNKKLDTIKESVIEMQANAKRMQLNEKNLKVNLSNQPQQQHQLPKSSMSQYNSATPKSSMSRMNDKNKNDSKPPLIKKVSSQPKLNFNLHNQSNISAKSATVKTNLQQQAKHSNPVSINSKINRSRSIEKNMAKKEGLDLGLFTPTTAPSTGNTSSHVTNVSSAVNNAKKHPVITKKKSIISKNCVNKMPSDKQNELINRQQQPSVNCEPNEKNKNLPITENLNEKNNGMCSLETLNLNESAITTVSEMKPNISISTDIENDPIFNSNLSRKSSASTSRNNLRLEITSSRVNLVEKSQSTPKHSVAAAHSNEMNRLLSAANKLNKMPDASAFIDKEFTNLNQKNNKINVDQPTQPVIVAMFEDFPQPFTSQSVNGVKSGSKDVKSKNINIKKPKKNFYAKQQQRTSSGSKSSKSKHKSTKSKSKSQANKIIVTSEINNSNDIQSLKIHEEDEAERNLLIDNEEKSDYENSKISQIGQYENEDFEDDDSVASFVLGDDESDSESKRTNGKIKDIEDTEASYLQSHSAHSYVLPNEKTSSNLNESTTKLNKDFVKSFEDKVFAIYNKFDNLLNQQENKLDKIATSSINETTIGRKNTQTVMEQLSELNEQKAQFSEEIARELSENVNFEEISSNPDLVKRLKELYDLVKTNGNNNQTHKIVNKPPVPPVNNNDSINKNVEDNKARKLSVTFSSVKSNANIREVYSIVNSIGSKKNSMNNTEPCNDNTITNSKTMNASKKNKIYNLPMSLTDTLHNLMGFIPNANNSETNLDSTHLINTLKPNDNNLNEFNSSHGKLKLNNTNGLDSIGNESTNSLNYDPNSISYHYDVKYRNEVTKTPVSLQIEDANDFHFRWKRGNMIGKGAFGSVYQAMLSTGAIIAVKQIEMEEGMDAAKARQEYDNVREEVKILRELNHINIVQFMGTMLEGNVVNIFMELIPGGTIETLLKIYGPFEENLFKNFTNQIFEGVNYIHSQNVVHRDIKGKNIMLTGNGIIKLIDFGCAKRLKKNQSSNSIKQLLKSLKGTPYWMSPEVIKETGHGSKADIWSCGATIFEMATGLPPYSELTPISAIYTIGSGESPPPELPLKFSKEARNFVSKCLTRSPDLRPSASELLEHEFLKN